MICCEIELGLLLGGGMTEQDEYCKVLKYRYREQSENFWARQEMRMGREGAYGRRRRGK